MQGESQENYYQILDLDPEVDDWSKIEARLLEKKKQWGREMTMGAPAARRKAERYSQMYPQMIEALKDANLRREHAQAYKRIKEQERRETIEELDYYITRFKEDGYCTEADVKNICARLGSRMTEKEIRDRIIGTGISIEEQKRKHENKKEERLIDVEENAIRRLLGEVHCMSLYDLLGETERTPARALREKAEALSRELIRIGKTDADSKSRNELYGICLKLFNDEFERKRYDNSRAVANMDKLRPRIDFEGERNNFISLDALDALVAEARKEGVSEAAARAYVVDYVEKKKWKVQLALKLPSTDRLLCGYCSSLAPKPDATHCANCGEPLHLECPRCHNKVPTQDRACSQCGFDTASAPYVKGLLKEGRRHVVQGNFQKAIRCYDEALTYWPGAKDLLDAKKGAVEQRDTLDRLLQSVHDSIHATLFFKAAADLASVERTFGPASVEELREQIERGIAQARVHFTQGESLRSRGQTEDAYEKYSEALRLCTDFEQARRAIAECPPLPPEGIVVAPLSETFHLTWQPSKTRGSLSYVILRKERGRPINERDGTAVGETNLTGFDDTTAPVGIPIYYSVYASRNKIFSEKCVSSGPYLRVSEVANLTAQAGNREITLSWQPPSGCVRVDVWRNSPNPPSKRGEGNPVSVTTNRGLVDTQLVNGRGYGYLVVAVFDGPTRPGNEIHTTGAVCRATPIEPPATLLDLKCTWRAETVFLEWSPPHGADVQIRYADAPPAFAPGTVIPMAHADRCGVVVPKTGDGNAQMSVQKQGVAYFTPITFIGSTGVVGHTVSLTTIEPVRNVRAFGPNKRLGNVQNRSITVLWEWPRGAEELVMCYSLDGYAPGVATTNATKVRIAKRESDANRVPIEGYTSANPDRVGLYSFSPPKLGRYYITLFTKAANSDAFAVGVQAEAYVGDPVPVRYRLEIQRAFMTRTPKEVYVDLQCDGLRQLPSRIRVVGKQGNIPISPTDGIVVAEASSVSFVNGGAAIPIDNTHWRSGLYVRLFFTDDDCNEEVRLLPASKEQLQLL